MQSLVKKISKATRNYILNIVTLVPFFMLLISGIVILRYHGGEPYETMSLGMNGHTWLRAHRILALVVIPLIVIHLWFHGYWIKKLFSFKNKNKGKNNDMNLILFVVFVLTVLTALISWFLFSGKPAAELLREVHNKLGFALIFFFIVHLVNYFRWLLKMTKKTFGKK
jgi:hypothetical protein